LGDVSKNGAVSTFGGVSTSDSEECLPCGLDIEVINMGEMSDAAAAAGASLTAVDGKLT